MNLDPATGNGYVMLTNGNTNMNGTNAQVTAYDAMSIRLMELANSL